MSRFRSPFPQSFLIAAFGALALLFATGATSAEEPKAATAEAQTAAAAAKDAKAATLKQRVDSYWKARIAGKTEEARGYYVPLPSGKLPADIAEYGNVQFSGYTLESVEEKGERGTAKVRVDATSYVSALLGGHMAAPGELKRPLLVENWKKVDGVWRKIAPNRSLSRIGRKPAEEKN